MKLDILRSVVLCGVALTTTVASWGATRPPYTYTQEAVSVSRTVMVGTTLGNNWQGFHDTLLVDYAPQEWWEQLDRELPLYVTWIVDTGAGIYEAQQVDPPQPLTSFSWFTGNHGRFTAKVTQGLNDLGYVTCPPGVGLEAPMTWSHPLTADGKLHVSDIHGGIGEWTMIHLYDCRPTPNDPGCGEMYNIYLGWDHPGTWLDWHTLTEVNRAPEDVHDQYVEVAHGTTRRVCYAPFKIVEWVSADIGVPDQPGPSPHLVEASDLAYLSSHLGDHVRWGFESGETPANSPTWQCNLAPFYSNLIDASDLAVFIADLEHNERCLLSKPGDVDETAGLLDWFGIAPTGQMVVVGPRGESLPGYDVVDWDRNRRAIADPYGYRASLNAAPTKEAPWGLVKQLFR